MVRIPGSSAFLNASTLANRQGIAAVQSTVLGDGGIGAVDILDIGRGNNKNGIGLSSRARLLNKQFLQSTTTNFNAIFSLGLGANATIEGMQQRILALRAGLSERQLAESLRASDDGGVASSKTGQKVDTEA